jgi:rubrerythrin
MAELTEKIKDYASSATIKHEMLMDKLSEFLTVEKGGAKLYQAALQQVRNPDVVSKFREFYEQTLKHQDILTRVVRDLGGDPSYMSRGALLAQQKAEALLQTMTMTDGITPKQAEINAMENIILAETKDHADWELLGKIARRTTDSGLSGILKPAVDEVEPEEDEHLTWTKQQMATMAINAMSE